MLLRVGSVCVKLFLSWSISCFAKMLQGVVVSWLRIVCLLLQTGVALQWASACVFSVKAIPFQVKRDSCSFISHLKCLNVNFTMLDS